MPQNHSTFGTLTNLNEKVVTCELCPNLRRYCTSVAKKKRRQFMDWEYWGKPIPGFGDPQARLLILGLAPAAHGGNRTGRMFTGDGSAQFLMTALHRFGFANKPNSYNVNDGLQLRDAYMTAVVRCAPPRNRPKPVEIENCKRYWTAELRLLSRARVVVTLGHVAFDTYVKFLREKGLDTRGLTFHHAAFYGLPEPYPALSASYHPSRQNTQTGKLTVKMLDRVLREVQKFLGSASSNVL